MLIFIYCVQLRTICINKDCVELLEQFINYSKTGFTGVEAGEASSAKLCYQLNAKEIAQGSPDDYSYEIQVTKVGISLLFCPDFVPNLYVLYFS